MLPIQLKLLKNREQHVIATRVESARRKDDGAALREAIETLASYEKAFGVHDPTRIGDWQKMHDVALDKFDEFDRESVQPLIKILDECFGECFGDRSIWTYWSENESTYENDGSTKAAGTQYNALCSIAIARPIGDSWQEKTSWYYGSGHSVINYHSSIQLRNHDSKIKYSSCSLNISLYVVIDDVRNNAVRIDHGSYDTKLSVHKNEMQLLTLCNLIKANFDAKVMHDRIKDVLARQVPPTVTQMPVSGNVV